MGTPVLNNDPHNVHPQNSSSDIEYWLWRSRAEHPQNSLTLLSNFNGCAYVRCHKTLKQ